MTRQLVGISGAAVLAFAACGDSSGGTGGIAGASTGAGGMSTGAGGTSSGAGGTSTGAGGMSSGAGGSMGTAGAGPAGGAGSGVGGTSMMGAGGSADAGSSTAPPCDQVKALALAYKAAHPGNGGKDWDILAKSPAQIAADPAAQQLLSLCGKDQLPVIPLMAWEYGGTDHPWINPEASALVYCVYIPVKTSTDNWKHDAATDHVTADVYVKCPDQNPCNNQQGANQVASCIGDPTNFEILVDTASINDGADVGLVLANSSTDLNLILASGMKVHLYTGL